ncbi:tetratricopeptide repeat protein [Mariniblastus sp.]|jgi:hypothetical protein|nr:tetratricopeptide repeat protein [Mariniblastus sp.]MDB4756545.1 tetratricopeptide repeat protein [Mariniblastus sp.]
MQRIPIIFTLWPGLPQLWLRGSWIGLGKAVSFAGFLNFILIATFWRPEWIPKTPLIGCWIVLGGTWAWAILRNDSPLGLHQKGKTKKNTSKSNQLFRSAQSEYLRGHVDEAEKLLERLILIDPEDLDAQLFLSTLHRHRGRLPQAEKLLKALEEKDQIAKWQFEIEDERKLIREMETDLMESQSDQSESPLSETGERESEPIVPTRIIRPAA